MVLLAPKRPAGLKSSAAGETYSVCYSNRVDPTFTAEPMSDLTNYLSNIWYLPVVDQTGLAGTIDFSVAPSAVDSAPSEAWGTHNIISLEALSNVYSYCLSRVHIDDS